MNKVPFKGIFLGKKTKFDAINGDKVFYRLEIRKERCFTAYMYESPKSAMQDAPFFWWWHNEGALRGQRRPEGVHHAAF